MRLNRRACHPVHQGVEPSRQEHAGQKQQQNVVRSDPSRNGTGQQAARSRSHHPAGGDQRIKSFGLLGGKQVPQNIPIENRQDADGLGFEDVKAPGRPSGHPFASIARSSPAKTP